MFFLLTNALDISRFQETTASIFSAALASQNSEKPASSASNVVLPSESGPLDALVASPSTASSVQPSETKSTVTSASTKENNDGTVALKVVPGTKIISTLL